jgi:hypothetical protein
MISYRRFQVEPSIIVQASKRHVEKYKDAGRNPLTNMIMYDP